MNNENKAKVFEPTVQNGKKPVFRRILAQMQYDYDNSVFLEGLPIENGRYLRDVYITIKGNRLVITGATEFNEGLEFVTQQIT